MKSKITIICVSLIVLLSFSSFSAFPKPPDTATYEKYYHQYVDSPEPLAAIQNRDVRLSLSAVKYMEANLLKPNYTIKYGSRKLHELDIYVHQGPKPAPVIIFFHILTGDKKGVQFAVRQWMSLGYTVVSINHRLVDSETSFADQLEDCFLALKWIMDNIKKRNVPF